MNINWKVRFKNPVFIAQLVLSIFIPILAYFGLTLEGLTSWTIVADTLMAAVSNPYVLGLTIISIWSAINDPTTKGVIDSAQAMTYEIPNDNLKNIQETSTAPSEG